MVVRSDICHSDSRCTDGTDTEVHLLQKMYAIVNDITSYSSTRMSLEEKFKKKRLETQEMRESLLRTTLHTVVGTQPNTTCFLTNYNIIHIIFLYFTLY